MLAYTLGPEQRDYSIGSGFYMKISDDLRKCVVFLGYEDDTPGMGGIFPIGTGFLFHYKNSGYLATARHVAKGLEKIPFILRLNRQNGLADNVYLDNKKWHYLNDNVDVAVMPCWITRKSGFDALYLPNTMLSLIGEKNTGIGDTCYTIGLFRFLTGEKRNLPIVHTGNIAMVPGDEKVPIKDKSQGKEITRYVEGYLIESQSLDGLSGSPVFVRPTTDLTLHGEEIDGITGSRVGAVDIFLIGIWQGAWNAPPDEIMAAEIGVGKEIRVSLGMGLVVPISKLIELLETPELQGMRMATDMEREANIPAVSLDAVAPTIKTENPHHKEDFNSLADAAAKKKTQDDET